MPEIAVILVVALVVLGPRRLPEMARTLGKGLAEFRKVTGDVNKELQSARDLIEREAREHERIGRQQTNEAAKPRSEEAPRPAPPPAATGEAEQTAGGSGPDPAISPESKPEVQKTNPGAGPPADSTTDQAKSTGEPPSNPGGSNADS